MLRSELTIPDHFNNEFVSMTLRKHDNISNVCISRSQEFRHTSQPILIPGSTEKLVVVVNEIKDSVKKIVRNIQKTNILNNQYFDFSLTKK